MPKGTVHAQATLVLAAASGYLSYHLGHPMPQVAALAGGTLAGLVLTPDLDIDEGCISDDIVRRAVGRKLGRLWQLYWRPYGLMLPHRSKLSHLPLLGTAIRLIYLAILPALVWWLAAFAAPSTALPHPTLPAWGWWAIGGLALADTLHFLMDQIF